MRILFDLPPLYDRIIEVFPWVVNAPVIFTFGDTIYNPMQVKISRELHKHEEIHQAQQKDTPLDWWEQYLVDVGFRLLQELPAHQVEYKEYCKRHGSSIARTVYLNFVAKRLSSELYGHLLTFNEARERILI